MRRPAHITADTDLAYRGTAFTVFADDGDIIIRVDSKTPALDALLDQHGRQEWAFVTASNPHPSRLTPAENRSRNDALRRDVASEGLPAYQGEGRGTDWSEESVLVIGMPLETAVALGRKYGQAAIVCGRRGDAARLIYCDSSEP